ncbi:MAG: hypothetical protein IPM82_23870 [Saprospiraceae bacterium]|nr:hypothetical protein [Saprospiraceae bacterium]
MRPEPTSTTSNNEIFPHRHTGFVGGYLAKLLRKEGHEESSPWCATPTRRATSLPLAARPRQRRVTRKESIEAATDPGCDGVFHVAGWYKVGARRKKQERKACTSTWRALETFNGIDASVGHQKAFATSTLAVNSGTRGVQIGRALPLRRLHL